MRLTRDRRGRFGFRRGLPALVATLALAGTGIAVLSLPSMAAAQQPRGCNDILPVTARVNTKFSRNFALQYKKQVPISVSTRGYRVKRWQIQLYTFGGFKLGQSKRFKTLLGTKTKPLTLKFPMQPGKYTLVVKGTVGTCNEQEYDKVLHFRSCANKLPIHFVNKPDGFARDYDGYVSVKVQPTHNFVIHDLTGQLFSFGGTLFGKSHLNVLFGTEFLNNKLTRPLRSGHYTFIVSGFADQPRACGPKTKQTTLHFR